ncbi:mitochondrial fission process protein 1 [Biomphalaria pfeifferi]|uniref:Mitochondrial fission process protein 1 n=1 Tax=Biomphalaria pfeifferi TaxID=112525 RepID=A0AAD8F1D7_BIOPF|nr:mitochondrial fission process protein 1 [Biomphalaria pfeifferi]
MDGFRIFPVRHIGHTWAINEALIEIILPEHINFCYVVTGVYIVSHAVWNGFRAPQNGIIRIADTFLFDGFASVILPTLLTSSVYRLSRRAFEGIAPRTFSVYFSTGLTMLALFSLCDYIDEFVDSILDVTVRTGVAVAETVV